MWPLGITSEWTSERIRHIRCFVEEVDLSEDQLEMVMQEELCDHREGILCVLIDFACKLCNNELCLPTANKEGPSDEELGTDRAEVLENTLHLVEMTLRSLNSSSNTFSSSFQPPSPCRPVRLDLTRDSVM